MLDFIAIPVSRTAEFSKLTLSYLISGGRGLSKELLDVTLIAVQTTRGSQLQYFAKQIIQINVIDGLSLEVLLECRSLCHENCPHRLLRIVVSMKSVLVVGLGHIKTLKVLDVIGEVIEDESRVRHNCNRSNSFIISIVPAFEKLLIRVNIEMSNSLSGRPQSLEHVVELSFIRNYLNDR